MNGGPTSRHSRFTGSGVDGGRISGLLRVRLTLFVSRWLARFLRNNSEFVISTDFLSYPSVIMGVWKICLI